MSNLFKVLEVSKLSKVFIRIIKNELVPISFDGMPPNQFAFGVEAMHGARAAPTEHASGRTHTVSHTHQAASLAACGRSTRTARMAEKSPLGAQRPARGPHGRAPPTHQKTCECLSASAPGPR